jgi:hypothetical protein
MYNMSDSQEQNGVGWEFCLTKAKKMFSETTDKKRQKALRYSVRAFETLIRQRAVMPQGNSQTNAATQS